MRILFIHQNFPGQFGQLATALAGRPGLDVYGLGNESNIALKPQQSYPVFAYRPRKPAKSSAHHYLHSFEAAIRRGQDVVLALQTLRQKNIVPDLVIGHPAWGELLFVKDVFPAAKVITYCEYFYRAEGGDVGFDPLPFETSRAGVFAAGDVRAQSMKRVAAAVGDGSSAIRSVHQRLAPMTP